MLYNMSARNRMEQNSWKTLRLRAHLSAYASMSAFTVMAISRRASWPAVATAT